MEIEKGFWTTIMTISLASAMMHIAKLEAWDSTLLLVLVVLIAVYTAWEILRGREIEVEHIISFLMISVGLLTYWLNLHLEGILLLGMFGLAEILEQMAMEKAESGLRELMEYLPRKSKVKRNDEILEVDFDSIKRGDLVVVARGERLPVDGIVVGGEGHLDQSVVTGEPLPVKAGEGRYVYSGSLLLDGSLVVKALKVGKESFISRMLSMVEKFKERKSSSERLIQKFSKYYLPSMLLLSLLAWVLLGVRAAIVLVAVACPSAFLVAAPATTLTSLAIAARRGVLFKGSAPIEKAAKVRIAALDKTGTLTLGRLVIKDVKMDEESFRLLASLELASQHPVAKAIVEEARNRGLRLSIPEEVEEFPGEGIRGRVEGVEVAAGKASFIGVEQDDGGMTVHLSVQDRYAGSISLGDKVNPEAKEIVDRLKDMGMHVVILTGDKRENAELIASSLGVEEFHAELSPEDKVRKIEELRKHGPVAMVGDGINDSPALAAADLGVAVGSLEASIEAGDVALMSGIGMLPWLFKSSKRSIKSFWTNIALVGLSKATAIVLGISGMIPLWTAVALGDDGGLLLVMGNLLAMAKSIAS